MPLLTRSDRESDGRRYDLGVGGIAGSALLLALGLLSIVLLLTTYRISERQIHGTVPLDRAPGRVLAVGDDARLADSEFGPGLIHAPSMRLAGWRFTGGAGG